VLESKERKERKKGTWRKKKVFRLNVPFLSCPHGDVPGKKKKYRGRPEFSPRPRLRRRGEEREKAKKPIDLYKEGGGKYQEACLLSSTKGERRVEKSELQLCYRRRRGRKEKKKKTEEKK